MAKHITKKERKERNAQSKRQKEKNEQIAREEEMNFSADKAAFSAAFILIICALTDLLAIWEFRISYWVGVIVAGIYIIFWGFLQDSFNYKFIKKLKLLRLERKLLKIRNIRDNILRKKPFRILGIVYTFFSSILFFIEKVIIALITERGVSDIGFGAKVCFSIVLVGLAFLPPSVFLIDYIREKLFKKPIDKQ